MRNVHVLPGKNNKSKIAVYHYDGSKNIKVGELGLQISNNTGWTHYWSPRELYITNDEEIKQGDWFITKANDILKAQKPEKGYEPTGKKIILTTDAELKIQLIDNEFLEWFVKNPNCEKVKVWLDTDTDDYFKNIAEYKIIIPKVCTGCGKLWSENLGKNHLGDNFLACCPDSNYILKQERMYSDMEEYATFCTECDRKEMPLLLVEDWYKHYKK